jgi:hypothetical protein
MCAPSQCDGKDKSGLDFWPCCSPLAFPVESSASGSNFLLGRPTFKLFEPDTPQIGSTLAFGTIGKLDSKLILAWALKIRPTPEDCAAGTATLRLHHNPIVDACM